jgi:carboxy-cis,cis-muconate cyclase
MHSSTGCVTRDCAPLPVRTVNRTLFLAQNVPTSAPHSYLAKDVHGDRVYATSWSSPPTLSSWSVKRTDDCSWNIENINTVNTSRHVFFPGMGSLTHIHSTFHKAAISGYIAIPPPSHYLYSVGGPTGEVHIINASSGGVGQEVQQVLFVPEDDLEQADKTPGALVSFFPIIYLLILELSRVTRGNRPMVPMVLQSRPEDRHSYRTCTYFYYCIFSDILLLRLCGAPSGTNSILMYDVDDESGRLTMLSETRSPRENDGPRHAIVSPNGTILYCITEHSVSCLCSPAIIY